MKTARIQSHADVRPQDIGQPAQKGLILSTREPDRCACCQSQVVENGKRVHALNCPLFAFRA